MSPLSCSRRPTWGATNCAKLSLFLVLWVNDHVLQAINHYAPDLKSFATAPIDLTIPQGNWCITPYTRARTSYLPPCCPGDDSPYAHSAPAYRPGSALRNELTFALADIEKNHCTLDPELTASLSFLKGRDAFSKGDLEVARFHFEQSLAYWQTASDHPTPLADHSNPSNSLTDITPPKPTDLIPLTHPPLPPLSPPPLLPFSHSPGKTGRAALLPGGNLAQSGGVAAFVLSASLQQAKQYFESCLQISCGRTSASTWWASSFMPWQKFSKNWGIGRRWQQPPERECGYTAMIRCGWPRLWVSGRSCSSHGQAPKRPGPQPNGP
jgi:hypothetical protein